MSNKFQQIAKAAGSMTALALSLGLLGQIPAQASLIGDQVNLEIGFNGEAPDFVSIPGGSQAIVEPSSGNFPEGVEFVNVFAGSVNGIGENVLSFRINSINVEDSLFDSSFDFRWNLVGEEVQPFTWEVTLNDLNWVDYPTGKIVDVELFETGAGGGSFLDTEGILIGDRVLTFENVVSVSHTDDSVTLAFSIDPTFGLGFGEGFANGGAGGFVRVDLIVEHDDPVATPEPTALGALLALGALGVSKKMKKK
ncbi:MAG: hypothetical protein F6K18_18640 [Okeania sp. SIO2C2]|uniref:hypothetical protein n=1 Tax=Okeania sp. SIO2C2 TaxID=2607787 RepID=UPI0013B9BAA4|nr:hypothetical protein [Okeania sp. SIO2C2]NEP88689.1 hypothetical protein [Okeania sp. SIO2C2]